jgi:hypothetical protein
MNDQEWMRGMFDKTQGATEPVWAVDTAALARGGARRRRTRTLSAIGGGAGVMAVTAAVVVSLGGLSRGGASPAGTPVHNDVFQYADITVGSSASGGPFDVVPASAVDWSSMLIDALDPGHAHLRRISSAPGSPSGGKMLSMKTVADRNSAAKSIDHVLASSVWTADGTVPARDAKVPSGSLQVLVAYKQDSFGTSVYNKPDTSVYNLPCGYALMAAQPFQDTPGQHDAHWSACKVRQLGDGSKIDSSSTPDGTGTVTVAVRQFPGNAGGIALVWTSYGNWKTNVGDAAAMDRAPDPGVVLKPSPFSEQQLVAALGDLEVGSGTGAPSAPSGGEGPRQFLKTVDLGAGAAYQPDSGSLGDLPMDNGCDYKDVNPLAKPGRQATYTVTTPSGKSVIVTESEYPLPAGTGPSTMATARSQAQGGCADYAKDTQKALPLPAGTGDEAFVENWVGGSAYVIWIRFGDSIVRVDVDQPGGGAPDLSAQVDQDWLTTVGKWAAVRWVAKS